MQTERRVFDTKELRVATVDGEPRRIVGHAAVFDALSRDLGGFRERIDPGAFTETIANDDIVAMFNHDPNLVLGRTSAGTLRLREDSVGLMIEIDPPDTVFARDLMVSIERGDISGMSFTFRVGRGDDSIAVVGDKVTRTLHKVQAFDVSPVTLPAYPDTNVGVRSVALWMENRDKKQQRQPKAVRRILRPSSTY